MLNGLDLFSGIGGISIALSDWVRPIAYCEIDAYCQGVLLSRMANRELASAPIWDDIRTLSPSSCIDIIYGGFPCQDISVAGLGKGLAGERSGLFYEVVRLAKEIKPKFIFLENVPAISMRGGLQIVKEITEMGYDCRWCVISAASVGALHKRERWFLLAHARSQGLEGFGTRTIGTSEKESLPSGGCNDGNTDSESSQQTNSSTESEQAKGGARRGSTGQHWPFESREHWQETVCGVCRTSDGVQFQVDRLKSLGNSVVPIQAKEAFKILMGIK
jgi:DNA (cytosine-5)-methyltransferase 1